MKSFTAYSAKSGVSVCRDGLSYERLKDMRSLYEGYALTLSRHLSMPLPPWISDQPHKDNWLTVARLRAQTEAANSSSDKQTTADEGSQTIAALLDEHHEF